MFSRAWLFTLHHSDISLFNRYDYEQRGIQNILGEEICEYCPWRNGEIEHKYDSLCEGTWCDDALDNFMDENQDYFDNEE